MATVSMRTLFPVTSDWVDIVNDPEVGDSTLSNQPVGLTSKAPNGEDIYIVWGGAEAPSAGASSLGDHLNLYNARSLGQSTNIWVRSPNSLAGSDLLSVTKMEA